VGEVSLTAVEVSVVLVFDLAAPSREQGAASTRATAITYRFGSRQGAFEVGQ
jgi:hypothetical protein